MDAAATLDALVREAHAEGHTIIMTTHELDHVGTLAERAVIISRGVVAYDAPMTPDIARIYVDVTGTVNAR